MQAGLCSMIIKWNSNLDDIVEQANFNQLNKIMSKNKSSTQTKISQISLNKKCPFRNLYDGFGFASLCFGCFSTIWNDIIESFLGHNIRRKRDSIPKFLIINKNSNVDKECELS